MVLSPKIEVRVSAISGRGLYATEAISKGETVRASPRARCSRAGLPVFVRRAALGGGAGL